MNVARYHALETVESEPVMTPSVPDDEDHETKADLTPLIDLIFLLLVFLILTTVFIPKEDAISSLLPRAGTGPSDDTPPVTETLRIRIMPPGLERGMSRADALQVWRTRHPDRERSTRFAVLMIGEREVVLDRFQGDAAVADQITTAILDALGRVELDGVERRHQARVEIHCFSGLDWAYALWAYDAVRLYEREQGAIAYTQFNPDEIAMIQAVAMEAREVGLAPPRVGPDRERNLGDELVELIHLP